ncbi:MULTISPECIES: hypothetical protein [Pseudomonas]|uniref:hypothetical protein n=1 Tax=Pseudomonas nitroreducens TaxID=46680 RepID=UPI001E4E06CA|nr:MULTISPECIES: hypothetical protein [Pseudomonas]MCE4073502.1 hypothetical protein [Pseudomonas nitritireducens]MCE4079741.1 hypothetical protein [Pseudomonas nitroreducens]
MKERPILFNGPMVRAILEGQKTVTRRAVKGAAAKWLIDFTPEFVADKANDLCPFGVPGDRLWVRETTEADYESCDSVVLARYSADEAPVLYWENDDGEPIQAVDHWNYPRDVRPSIHMKREACRILLEITAVRVERLQDITEEQAEAEGAVHASSIKDFEAWAAEQRAQSLPVDPPRAWFIRLWEHINGAGSWDDNPWVWVVEFERVTQ